MEKVIFEYTQSESACIFSLINRLNNLSNLKNKPTNDIIRKITNKENYFTLDEIYLIYNAVCKIFSPNILFLSILVGKLAKILQDNNYKQIEILKEIQELIKLIEETL